MGETGKREDPICKGCGAPLVFAKTSKGNWIPLSKGLYPVLIEWDDVNKCRIIKNRPKNTYVIHFDVCPKADKKKRQEQNKAPNDELEEVPF